MQSRSAIKVRDEIEQAFIIPLVIGIRISGDPPDQAGKFSNDQ